MRSTLLFTYLILVFFQSSSCKRNLLHVKKESLNNNIIFNVCQKDLISELYTDTGFDKLRIEYHDDSVKLHKVKSAIYLYIKDSLKKELHNIRKLQMLKTDLHGIASVKTYYLVDYRIDIFSNYYSTVYRDSIIACLNTKCISIGIFEIPVKVQIYDGYTKIFNRDYLRNQPIIIENNVLLNCRFATVKVTFDVHTEIYKLSIL